MCLKCKSEVCQKLGKCARSWKSVPIVERGWQNVPKAEKLYESVPKAVKAQYTLFWCAVPIFAKQVLVHLGRSISTFWCALAGALAWFGER